MKRRSILWRVRRVLWRVWRSVVLYLGIVGRVNQGEYRTGPILAARIVKTVVW